LADVAARGRRRRPPLATARTWEVGVGAPASRRGSPRQRRQCAGDSDSRR
jgi:hypothetical protein